MSAGEWNFTIERGATFTRPITWTIDGEPVDLTGASATMRLTNRAGAALTLTSNPAAGITLGGAAGTITLSITAVQTAALTAATLRHVLNVTLSDGTVHRLLQGDARVIA